MVFVLSCIPEQEESKGCYIQIVEPDASTD